MDEPRVSEDRRIGDAPVRVRVRRVWRDYRHDVWLLVLSIVILITVSTAVSGSKTANQASRHARAAASQASAVAQSAAQLAAEIQQQRVDSVSDNCNAQNKRHDGTIAALDRIPPFGPQTRAARAQAARGRAEAVLLINALQPHQDCTLVVDAALGLAPPPVVAIPPILPPGSGVSRQHR